MAGTLLRMFCVVVLMKSAWAATALANGGSMPTATQVDLARYMGHWYEIAAIPQIFERNCFASQADYSLRSDGKVHVVNSCHKGSLEGPITKVRGTAEVVDTTTNAKLKITFFWPFAADYWILAVDDDYTTAMVGSPNRKSLWILSRQSELDDATYEALLTKAAQLGFDVQTVSKMPQQPTTGN